MSSPISEKLIANKFTGWPKLVAFKCFKYLQSTSQMFKRLISEKSIGRFKKCINLLDFSSEKRQKLSADLLSIRFRKK